MIFSFAIVGKDIADAKLSASNFFIIIILD